MTDSIKALFNLIFEKSEASNSYIYRYYSVPDGTTPTAAFILFGLIALVVLAICFRRQSKVLSYIVITVFAMFQVVFGISFSMPVNVIFFSIIGSVFLRKPEIGKICCYTAAVLVCLAAVTVIYPGVNSGIEDVSELARDRIDRVEQSVTGVDLSLYDQEKLLANSKEHRNHQSRFDVVEKNVVESPAPDNNHFNYVEEFQTIISKPGFWYWIKTVLMFVLIFMVLTVPFVPLYLIMTRRRKAMEHRELFKAADLSASVGAIFEHIVKYLDYSGIHPDNRAYSLMHDEIVSGMGEEFAENFGRCHKVWQKAVFSNHAVLEEERESVHELLEQVEKTVYERSGNMEKIRLRYILCLHE